MNILFLFQNPIIPHIGGVQRVTHILSQEFLLRGHHIVYLCTSNREENHDFDYLTKQYYIDCNSNKVNVKNEYLLLLEKESVQVVINQEPRLDTCYLLSITPDDIKKITCLHVQPFQKQTYGHLTLKYLPCHNWKEFLYVNFCRIFPKYYYNQSLRLEVSRLNRALEVSDYLCLLSNGFISRIKKYMPNVDDNKLIAINNPSFLTNSPILKKEKLIIWVGRQSNSPKNLPEFIDIWDIISRHNPSWKAIIVGDGEDINYNMNYAKKRNVCNLEFVGLQTNVNQFYERASFIGMTSFFEGWGMVLTEAMSYGCIPFVYNTYESVNDIIEDGKDGILVKPFDKQEMAYKIQLLIDNQEIFSLFQSNAINKVRRFDVKHIVNFWENFLND